MADRHGSAPHVGSRLQQPFYALHWRSRSSSVKLVQEQDLSCHLGDARVACAVTPAATKAGPCPGLSAGLVEALTPAETSRLVFQVHGRRAPAEHPASRVLPFLPSLSSACLERLRMPYLVCRYLTR